MKKILFAAVALVAAMSSCSKEDSSNGDNNGVAEIKLRSGISAQTRAAYSGDVAVAGLQFLRADAAATTNDFTGKTPIVGSRAVGGAITFGNAQYYAAANNTYFASYFPVGNLANNVITWGIDAKTDIMTAATINAGSQASHATPESFVYKHELAQIEVVCKMAATGNDISTRWGQIQSIKLKNTPATMSYAYNGLAVTQGAPTSDIALVQADYTTTFAPIALPANTSAAVNAAGMFAPLASQNFQLEIATESNGTKVITIDLGSGNELAKGKKHVITLTFNAATTQDEIVVSSTIEEWAPGATGTGELN